MSKNINILELINKHDSTLAKAIKDNTSFIITPKHFGTIIKEIVEAVVDKCANIPIELKGSWEGAEANQAILNVKTMIDY